MSTDIYPDIVSDVALFVQSVDDLDVDAICALDETARLALWAEIEDANRTLQQVRALLTQAVAEAMSCREVVVDNVGTFLRHVKKDRTQWEKDDLLRAVLDSRNVDPRTGEVADETPLDKVLAVWNLPAPRTTILRQRGIDADEFCHVERGGWTIEVLR